MWHFGVDTIQEYADKEFEVTFGDGIYTKRMKGRTKVRSERQRYPNLSQHDVKSVNPDNIIEFAYSLPFEQEFAYSI